MRFLDRGRVLFIGPHRCPEFDAPQGPLPENLKVLLCLLDGAERRRHLQAKLDVPLPPAQRALETVARRLERS